MKLVFLQILLMIFSPLLIAEEVELWHDGKISPEQPFKALVIGVIPGWGSDTIILQEIGEQERYCFAIFHRGLSTYEVQSKEEYAKKKLVGATVISPGVEVERFSWTMGVHKIGKIFGEDDLVSKWYTESKSKSKQPAPNSKSEKKEKP